MYKNCDPVGQQIRVRQRALVQRAGYLARQLLDAPEYGDVSRLASQVALRAEFIGSLRGMEPSVFAMPVYKHVGGSPQFLFAVHVPQDAISCAKGKV